MPGLQPIPAVPCATPVGRLSAHLRPSHSAVRYQATRGRVPAGNCDKAEQAYRRSDALARRRESMDAWAHYCEAERARKSWRSSGRRGGLLLQGPPATPSSTRRCVRVSFVSTDTPWLPSPSDGYGRESNWPLRRARQLVLFGSFMTAARVAIASCVKFARCSFHVDDTPRLNCRWPSVP